MAFSIDDLDRLLPPELSEQKKGRLKDSLRQFYKENQSSYKLYKEFYLTTNDHPSFLQGDLIAELRFPMFNYNTKDYNKVYSDIIVLSNSCDMDTSNDRKIPKNILTARIVAFDLVVEALQDEYNIEKAADIATQIQSQLYSNIFYLPSINEKEYIAYLDDTSNITIEELGLLKENLSENRIASLDFFGYYLFVLKLSYHLCRLPEETDR